MENKVWAVISECKCDGDDEFDSFFSLFRNYTPPVGEILRAVFNLVLT